MVFIHPAGYAVMALLVEEHNVGMNKGKRFCPANRNLCESGIQTA